MCARLVDGHRSAEEFGGNGADVAAVGDELEKGEGGLVRGQYVPCESRWRNVVGRCCPWLNGQGVVKYQGDGCWSAIVVLQQMFLSWYDCCCDVE